jgi:hypothetical protein
MEVKATSIEPNDATRRAGGHGQRKRMYVEALSHLHLRLRASAGASVQTLPNG